MGALSCDEYVVSAEGRSKIDMGRAVLNLFTWLRVQAGLRAIYQHFSQDAHFRISQLLASQVRQGVNFERNLHGDDRVCRCCRVHIH